MLFAKEELSPASRDMCRQDRGNPLGLILATFEFASGVLGNRHEYRASLMAAEHFVREGRVGQVVGQEWATFVFDAVNDPPGGAAGTEGTDRPGEGGLEVEAMGASPVTFEDAFEGVPAGQAPGVGDPGELVGPGGR